MRIRPGGSGLVSESSGQTDEELLVLVRSGDSDAFATLYRRYQDAVHRFAWKMSGREAIAEDITQDAFLTLTRGARHYDPRQSKFKTYLYGMVRHLTRRRLRRDRVFVFLAGEDADRWKAGEPLIEHSLVEKAAKERTIERVRRAVLSLPQRYREVVVLCDLHGRDYTEAAAAAGCAVGTVRSRLHRGRALLRQKLAPVEHVDAQKPFATPHSEVRQGESRPRRSQTHRRGP